MANEAILRVRLSDPIDMTVSNTTGIEKGAICILSDPLTAAASTNGTASGIFAGIMAREKIASDGRTKAPLYRRGIFDLTVCGTAVGVGQWVSLSGANLIKTATEAEIAAGNGIGIALEAGDASEVINVMVGGY